MVTQNKSVDVSGGSSIKVEVEVPMSTGGQARNENTGNSSPSASGGQQNEQTMVGDNRGKVLHPETDGRLKGNEQNRPNDKDRSAQAAGGQKGGTNSHQNHMNRSNNT